MNEQFCEVGRGITLCYETFGDPSDPPAVLVMGLGTQMVGWPDDLCGELAKRGFYVVRFDNRDIGRSTHVSGRAPTAAQLLRRSRRAAHYTLEDMAADAAGLVSELGLAPAHVIGASMGGMIAQTLAAHHPESVRSLVSIMSTTGGRWVGQPALRLYPIFLRRAVSEDREAFIERTVGVFRAIGSRGLPQSLDDIREIASVSYERDRDPYAPSRQLAAILASGDRSAALGRISAPTMIIHGTDDRLVAPSGARATQRAIPGSRLTMIDGMGHDLPRAAWPRILDAIAENAARVDRVAQPA